VGVSGIKYTAKKSRAGKALKIQAKTFHGTKAPMMYAIKIPSERKMAVKAPRAPRTRGDAHSPICWIQMNILTELQCKFVTYFVNVQKFALMVR
jgi:hypothetical protein